MKKNGRFGKLLSEGITSIAAKQGQNIGDIERKLADEMDFTHHTIQRWRRGFLPKEEAEIAFLVRYCVANGRLDKMWAESFLTQAKYIAKDALLDELFPLEQSPQTIMPTIYQNLPPRYGEFLGREDDMARVLEGLNSRWPIVSIEGMGGVGKTTLAIETARQCLPGKQSETSLTFTAVVWTSAKDQPEQKEWLNEVLDNIARVLDYPYITQLSLSEKKREIDKLLRSHCTLVIIDNFETIEDKALEHWLQRIPEPSKLLLTGRYAQLRTVWAVPLAGLPDEKAIQLIRHHSHRLTLSSLTSVSNDALLPLVRVTEGNPKALEMAVGYIKRGLLTFTELVDALHQARQSVNDIFDYLFTHAWERLDDPARHLFMATSFFVKSIQKEALAAVAGLTGYKLDTALGQLNDLGLLTRDDTSLRYSFHPLAHTFANSKLAEHPQWEVISRERWFQWSQQVMNKAIDPTNYSLLKPDIPTLMSVLEWLLDENRLADLAHSFQKVQRLCFAEGYWWPFLHFTDEILEWAESTDNFKLFWSIFHHFINVKTFQRQHIYEAGKGWLKQAQLSAGKTSSGLLQAEIWLAQSRLLEKGTDTIDNVQKALAIFREYQEDEKVVLALNHLGNIYLWLEQFEEAVAHYTEGLEILDTSATTYSIHEPDEWKAILKGNMGLVLGRQGYHNKVSQILNEIIPSLVDKTDRAEALAALAYYEGQLGHLEAATQLRSQADDLIQRLGLVQPICAEDKAWSELNMGESC